jgi:hypothetical protein
MMDQDFEKEFNDRARVMMDTLPPDWDMAPILLAHEIRTFLQSIKDQDTQIDSGTDGASGDLWVTIQGVEWFISIRRSNNQLAKEGKPIPRAA